jgi:HEAT repeat protein
MSSDATANKLRLSIPFAIGALLTATTWFTLSPTPTDASATESESELERHMSLVEHARFDAAGTSGQLCAFVPGTRMRYDVVSETIVEIDVSRLKEDVDVGDGSEVEVAASPAEAHRIERRWQLDLIAVALDEGASVLAARIEDHGVEVEAGEGEGAGITASPALSDVFLIRVDERCGIRAFGWRTDGDLEAAREQQLLASGLGFVAPRDTSEASSYGGTNFDATGRYAANYRYEDGRLEGEALSYSLADGVGRGAPISVEILASMIEVELGAGVWFESLKNERDLEMTFNARAFGSHFRSTNARRVPSGEFSPVVDLGDGGWSWGVLAGKQSDAAQQFDESLRDMPLADALARYRELVASGGVGEYGGMLRDWLRANPERTGELTAMLRAGEFANEQVARSGLFYALGSANTEQAKTALVDILREWPETRHQIAAAHALSMVEQPTREMLELVAVAASREDLHEVERGSMALALGAVAHSTEASHPEIAAEARGQIRDWLETPSGDEQISHALLAAGNAGHDELAAEVGMYLDHESPKIRKDAAQAVRQMSPEQAYPHLEQALADEDRSVRVSALETAASVARNRDRAPSEALVELASERLGDAEQHEQRAAISLLGEAAKRGDARADGVLRDHLRAQLFAEDRNAGQLAALGRTMPGHWKAD